MRMRRTIEIGGATQTSALALPTRCVKAGEHPYRPPVDYSHSVEALGKRFRMVGLTGS
jgi:hypothetical protein